MKQVGGAAAAATLGTNARLPDGHTDAPPDVSFRSRQVQGRVPPDEDAVLLDSNENPLGPSPAARQVAMDAFDRSFRYPGAAYRTLLGQIAEREQVSTDHIVMGTGSSEVLCMAGAAYGLHDGEVVTAEVLVRRAEQHLELWLRRRRQTVDQNLVEFVQVAHQVQEAAILIREVEVQAGGPERHVHVDQQRVQVSFLGDRPGGVLRNHR